MQTETSPRSGGSQSATAWADSDGSVTTVGGQPGPWMFRAFGEGHAAEGKGAEP